MPESEHGREMLPAAKDLAEYRDQWVGMVYGIFGDALLNAPESFKREADKICDEMSRAIEELSAGVRLHPLEDADHLRARAAKVLRQLTEGINKKIL